ncbi:MAG TPA: hypothetical protein VHX59_14990 [Mycobacteriales bacterium]|nr:hypothetical protein [Mycobacteriales bacterium]
MSGKRRPRRKSAQHSAPTPFTGLDKREEWRGEVYAVRPLRGSSSTKPYRCPGCEQEIQPGTPHVVVWPSGDFEATERRHWHTGCWNARDRRAPRQRRHF